MVIRLTNDQVPLYVRAKQALLRFIKNETRNGTLADNKLPAEEELCQMLGVSRPTVREALMALNRDGIVSKKHGTGNLIHRSTLNARMRFDKFSDFKALLEDNGYEVELESSPFKMPTEEDCKLLIASGGNCDGSLFQENLYFADKEPAVLAYNYPHCTMSNLRQMDKDASDGTFASFLEALSGEELAHTIVRLQPDIVWGKVAERLAITPGAAVIRLKESHYSVYDHLVAESVVFFNPQQVDLTILRKW